MYLLLWTWQLLDTYKFSNEISREIKKVILDTHNKMCQILGNLHKAVNKQFANEQFILLQNPAWKISFQSPLYFNVTKKKIVLCAFRFYITANF